MSADVVAEKRKKALETDIQRLGIGTEAIDIITPDRQQMLIQYYLSILPSIIKALQLSQQVEATASTYLHRFYLENSIISHHPKHVLFTAVFLAAKVENALQGLDSFSSLLHVDPEIVKGLELPLCEALDFDFKVVHAYRAAQGWLLELGRGDGEEQVFKTLSKIRLTDLELRYTPSEIALGVWWIEQEELVRNWASTPEREDMIKVDAHLIEEISQIKSLSLTTKAQALEIDQRLKSLTDDGSRKRKLES